MGIVSGCQTSKVSKIGVKFKLVPANPLISILYRLPSYFAVHTNSILNILKTPYFHMLFARFSLYTYAILHKSALFFVKKVSDLMWKIGADYISALLAFKYPILTFAIVFSVIL